ncbi:ADP-ribosyl-[dinitrogen reductase] glycohydrolase-like isoform X1 [Saccostrea echinata]|uniref:ADP-ribosyl-[dinitrogen reductase] glycohydrolase-like isoform X1 n=1 Tax=Saccostrea echinata TaxID=191078 RepID=UPI002A8268D2|nr:ADP-ribosyl-[dinitrogen reductase] glycohydrolase-like isoform X1 [Saccostrea echinata]
MTTSNILGPELQSRIRAVLYGQCVGDALGLLTEFLTKQEAKEYFGKVKDNLEYKHKGLVDNPHQSRWKEGDWSDDSDQMIIILMSLTDNNGMVNHKDIARRFLEWMKKGFPELGDFVGMGIGKTTDLVLHHKSYLDDPYTAAESVWRESQCKVAPNGAVMRTSILGVHKFHDLEQVARNAADVARITHYDPRCQASAVAVSVAIAIMLQKKEKHLDRRGHYDVGSIIKDSYNMAVRYIDDKEQKQELLTFMKCSDIKQLKLSGPEIGYTFKTLGSGFWALKQNDFRKAITKIVMQGGDADTNASVAGALLGCKLGLEAIPQSWKENLVHKEWLDQKIDRYFSMINEGNIETEEKSSS